MAEALAERGWPFAPHDWQLWLPSPVVDRGLDERLRTLDAPAGAVIGAVPGLRCLTRKRSLWTTLQDAPGVDAAAIVPRCWLPHEAPNRPLVAKDDRRQRRKGVAFVDDPAAVDVPARHLLFQEPITSRRIRGRTVSLRAWVLVERGDALRAWLFDDAAVIYAPKGDRITRSADAAMPRGAPRWLSAWEPGLHEALAALLRPALAATRLAPDLPGHRCFEWLGADFVVDDRPWLLELNRKPVMRPRHRSEADTRRAVLRGALDLAEGRPPRRYAPLGAWPQA